MTGAVSAILQRAKRFRVGTVSLVDRGAEERSRFAIIQRAADDGTLMSVLEPLITEISDHSDPAAAAAAIAQLAGELSAAFVEPGLAITQGVVAEELAESRAQSGGWDIFYAFREAFFACKDDTERAACIDEYRDLLRRELLGAPADTWTEGSAVMQQNGTTPPAGASPVDAAMAVIQAAVTQLVSAQTQPAAVTQQSNGDQTPATPAGQPPDATPHADQAGQGAPLPQEDPGQAPPQDQPVNGGGTSPAPAPPAGGENNGDQAARAVTQTGEPAADPLTVILERLIALETKISGAPPAAPPAAEPASPPPAVMQQGANGVPVRPTSQQPAADPQYAVAQQQAAGSPFAGTPIDTFLQTQARAIAGSSDGQ